MKPFWQHVRLPHGGFHPFFDRVSEILSDNRFDVFVEGLFCTFYADRVGRPSLAPAICFRLNTIGYFKGIDSESR
ncbi:MAG: hypothetical protein KF841_17125 [Phycisphaerae bacterium]|nr:hypothetical protein [Phycisphaerae bacterium]